jgi:3-isopropylmalate/(R)-2-methylmalate dehydratase large subunit
LKEFSIPKSLLIYKNDKLDLCESIAIINLRFSYPVL